jgi:anti-sigma factor RsiW
MISCQDLTEGLADFVAGELPDDRHAEFENHLAACPVCARALNDYQRVVSLARELPMPPLPEGLLERFRNAVEKDRLKSEKS